ncbi:hypothetical protein BABINDRAFT_165345 [Babjeviella inositovora NRRL Y-12698]|uniref:DUF7082 domain-containing protein n=1 Tax=Babjeviella inositovora NRRL Y-12698 TaxID=984486 RepID=A0A1E3QVX8_9ASCO|nr:uncharacterized protein BABINDRAFT_165345 [Babjeviella inositovora NRRL Y-12698]ODQ81826.1 hypothetical protein BABINDRAFT_165345 [Babjeviella inositovora NRRL Y-12698]
MKQTPKLVRLSSLSDEQALDTSLVKKSFELFIHNLLSGVTGNWNPEHLRKLIKFHVLRDVDSVSICFSELDAATRSELAPGDKSVISCIYCQDLDEFIVTSVDIIRLLEHIVDEKTFKVEEKGRIRRNLQILNPTTVSSKDPVLQTFYKQLMGMKNPRTCNIQKKIKVFPWSSLSLAIKKVLSKYAIVMRPGELLKTGNLQQEYVSYILPVKNSVLDNAARMPMISPESLLYLEDLLEQIQAYQPHFLPQAQSPEINMIPLSYTMDTPMFPMSQTIPHTSIYQGYPDLAISGEEPSFVSQSMPTIPVVLHPDDFSFPPIYYHDPQILSKETFALDYGVFVPPRPDEAVEKYT